VLRGLQPALALQWLRPWGSVRLFLMSIFIWPTTRDGYLSPRYFNKRNARGPKAHNNRHLSAPISPFFWLRFVLKLRNPNPLYREKIKNQSETEKFVYLPHSLPPYNVFWSRFSASLCSRRLILSPPEMKTIFY